MKETVLRIRVFPDPVLRKKTDQVKHVTQTHQNYLAQMARLMYENSGIGLAASQVGLDESMIAVDIGSGLYKLINPKIVKKEGKQTQEEGCLSIPGICIKVKRAKKIQVHALNEYGKPITINAEDLLACVLQHEIDHLKGKLIIDYASFFGRIKIRKKMEELKKSASTVLSTSTRSTLSERSESKGAKDEEKLSESERKSCKLQL